MIKDAVFYDGIRGWCVIYSYDDNKINVFNDYRINDDESKFEYEPMFIIMNLNVNDDYDFLSSKNNEHNIIAKILKKEIER